MADARRSDARLAEAGVTLIEMLVVLSLIGVSAGIVSYALPSAAPARTLDQEATLLAARLNIAAERSLTSGAHFRMDWRPTGYAFREWRDGDWQAATGAPLDAPHDLARGAVLSDGGGAQRGAITVAPDLMPEAAGVASLWVAAGAMRRAVTFNGAAARVQP